LNLTRSDNFKHLTHLWVQGNSIKEEGIQGIVMSETLNNLEHFNIKQNLIGDTGL